MENHQIIYSTTFFKPVRRMLEYAENVNVYDDMRVERIHSYSIFPNQDFMVDGIPLLNVYGQKIANDLYAEKMEHQEENADITLMDLEEDEVFDGNIRCDYSDL